MIKLTQVKIVLATTKKYINAVCLHNKFKIQVASQ